ncbi:hypothetical protein ciss_20040 [Carboxydothermus islandicus]|uniref:Uncharacterized protein n=1 Tax=Carboxydothermus islandicus TaxID=661089 RepID=A0A1L8D4S2_9THEO|nr:hypothetical protein [Carboxydothermus islandicus]GAV26071.1 hypothetical protein ciss_20040 [Carboxydothermus islandicus]
MIETTINAQTKNYLSEEELVRMLKNMEFNDEYAVQIFNFFTDVPFESIYRFLIKHNLSEKELLKYYRTFVKKYYPNPEFEGTFGYGISVG